MTVFLALVTAIAAGWIIDRLAFNGEFATMVRDEVAFTLSRRKQPPKAPRSAR